MKLPLVFSLFLIVYHVLNGQEKCQTLTIDTITYNSIGTEKTWFKGALTDTIFHYKELCIDTIVYNTSNLIFDTIFYSSHYEKGYRYINDTLFKTDFRKQEHGYLMNNKMVGHWDFTPSPSCFSNGTVIIDKRQYINGERIINERRDKYFFLKDSISGSICTTNSSLKEFSDTLLYSCFKNLDNNYLCKFYFENGETIKLVPLELMQDESNAILSGFRNNETRKTLGSNKHK